MSKYDLAYKSSLELPLSDAITGTDRFPSIDATTGAVTYIPASDLATYAASGGVGPFTVDVADASALAVGANGATNPVLKVDTNTASVATGLEVIGAAAAAGVAVRAISSGTDENLTLDAKGTGTITLAGTSTGNVVVPRTFAQGSNATDRVAIKGLYMSPANVAVTVPAITDPDIAKVDINVASAFSIQPAVGDFVIAAPQEAMEANARILGCYVTATDQITLVFGSEGGNVTGGAKNFKFFVVDVT